MKTPNPTDGRGDAPNDSTDHEQLSGASESSFNGDIPFDNKDAGRDPDEGAARDRSEPLTDFAEAFDDTLSEDDNRELTENLEIIEYIASQIEEEVHIDTVNAPYRIANEHFEENDDINLERVRAVMEAEFAIDDNGVVEGRKSLVERSLDEDDDEIYSAVSWDEVRNYITGGAPARQARQVMALKLNADHDWIEVHDSKQEFEDFRYYDPEKGYYVENGEDLVEQLLDEGTNGFQNTGDVREVVAKLGTRNRVPLAEANAGDAPLRCVANGVLNVETWELEPHSPEYNFTRRFEVPWDPDVDTSFVESFIRDITANETYARVLEEALGDILPKHLNGEESRDWFGVIYGPGGNGKSVLTNTVEAALGDDNVAVESLEDIVDTRWSAAQLAAGYGAVANIASDISGNTIRDAAMLKRLTGRDAVSVEKKGQNKHKARSTARMFFALNEPMMFSERKDSIVRRIKPINMPYKFKSESEYDPEDPMHKQKDPSMESKLRSEENLAALLQVMAKGLDRLREDGWSYELTQDELFDVYHREADTVHAFLHECIEQKRYRYTDNGASVYLTTEELATMYNRYAAERGEAGMKVRQFGEQLGKTTVHDIITIHPNRAGKKAAREWLVPSEMGWKYAPNPTKERFELYVDEIDVPSPDSEDDDDGSTGTTPTRGVEGVERDVLDSVIRFEFSDRNATFENLVGTADVSESQVSAAIEALLRDGLIEFDALRACYNTTFTPEEEDNSESVESVENVSEDDRSASSTEVSSETDAVADGGEASVSVHDLTPTQRRVVNQLKSVTQPHRDNFARMAGQVCMGADLFERALDELIEMGAVCVADDGVLSVEVVR